MNGLKSLLQDVLREDELRIQLKQNPESVFSQYDLTADERDAILDRNEIEIKRLAAQSRNEAGESEVYASEAGESEVYASEAGESEVYASEAGESEVYATQD